MASTYRDRTTEFRHLSDRLKKIGAPIDAAVDRAVPTTTQPTTSYRSEFNNKASRIGLGIHETSLKISELAKLFHVTDQNGNKLTDESVISYIEQSLGDAQFVRSKGFDGLTSLELTGTDRVGLTMAELHSLIYVSDINSLDEMEIERVSLDLMTYNSLIFGFCHAAQLIESRIVFDVMPTKVVSRDIIIYNTLIYG